MLLLPTLNLVLAIGGLVLAAVTIVLLVDYFVYNRKYFGAKIEPWLWPMIIVTTIGSVGLSLVYSEYFGFIPCSLCWLQRIAIYPQALLAVLAYRSRDTINFPIYGIGLSLFGLAVAIYQYIYQMLPVEARESGIAPCLVDGSGADCAVKVIDLFGFVTFPLLTAITFAFLTTLYLYLRRANRA
jgi:disulfide bond formation protein DsbB